MPTTPAPAPAATLKIKYVPLGDVAPAERNPKGHDIPRIVQSIERVGFVTPPVLDSSTDTLVAGHGRLEALRTIHVRHLEEPDAVPVPKNIRTKAKTWLVPVLVGNRFTDAEREFYVIADNRLVELGGWDEELLGTMLGDLADADHWDLVDTAGFDGAAFDRLQDLTEPEPTDGTRPGRTGIVSAARPNAKTRTKRGDTWILGDHLLHVGDSTTSEAYEGMPTKAALTFTDPPYNVDYESESGDKMIGDTWDTEDQYRDFLIAALQQIASRTAGAVYCCHGIEHAHSVRQAWDTASLHYSTTIAWVKSRFAMKRSNYHWQWEPIMYGWPTGQKHAWQGDRAQSNVWNFPMPNANIGHPTMKPIPLVEKAIANSSKPGDLILDPFGGSGSTLVAAANLGRRAYLIELDPVYADVILDRFSSLDGAKPKKA